MHARNGRGLPGLDHPSLSCGGQSAGLSSAGFQPDRCGGLLYHHLSLTRCPGDHRRSLGLTVMVSDREVRGSWLPAGIGGPSRHLVPCGLDPAAEELAVAVPVSEKYHALYGDTIDDALQLVLGT